MSNHAEDDLFKKFKDSWDKDTPTRQERILEIMSHFHFRDTKHYEDGSVGTIYISPKQFRDLLSWITNV